MIHFPPTCPPTARRPLIALVAVLGLLAAPTAGAVPAAYVERDIFATGTYGFTGLGAGVRPFGVRAGLDLPLDLPLLPVDFGVGLELAYQNGLSTNLSAKALLFPSLLGTPPVGVALQANLGIGFVGGVPVRFGVGPLLSADFSPLVVSLAPQVSFGSGGFAFDVGLGARFYFDPLAVDLGFDYSTLGVGSVNLGLRFLF